MPGPSKTEEDLSVTRWLSQLKDGDPNAAHRLWRFLEQRLQHISKSAVRQKRSGSYDEEDVAQSAFISLCDVIQQGRYEMLSDREALWKLLAVITINKARNRATSESRQKRGGGKVVNSDEELHNVASSELSPEEKMMMSEECARLMGLLERDELRHIAILKVEGLTNEAVAEQLGCSRRSVQRRLNLIREIWTSQIP